MQDFLGHGLLMPFRRDRARDFAAGGGEAAVRAAVQQVLGTVGASDFTQGELSWRTEFGSLLHLLRHQKSDVALHELAQVYVRDALRRWEPRVRVWRVDVTQIEDEDGAKLVIRLRYDIVPADGAGAPVRAGVDQTVTV